MKTGMVIINYNDYESVKHLIDNIKDYSVIDKIVIVDNNSKDEEKNKLKSIDNSKIDIIYNDNNLGFAKAINIGCKYLDNILGECKLIISNADIIINKENDLKDLLKYLDNKELGIVSPTIIEHGNKNRGWKNPTPLLDILMNIVVIHRKVRKKYIFYKEEHYKNDISEVEVVSGCFFLTTSSILKEINYLDENTFLYYEENILAKKISNINKKIIVCNNISITHNHAVSIDKNLKKLKKLKIQKQSQYYFQTKYNHANILERFLLKLIVFINRILLAIYYFIKDLFKR